MKKFLLIFFGVLALLLVTLVSLPFIFKDQIRAKIDHTIEATVDAEVYYDPAGFGLSIFKHFPKLTITLRDFGVVGKGEFAGDTLIAARQMDVSINLKTVLFGEKLRIQEIFLDEPTLMIKFLENGKGNYDIMIAGEESAEEEEAVEESDFSYAIDHWEIANGRIAYVDEGLKFDMVMEGVNHSGYGDFTLSVFDLVTMTKAEALSMSYEGMELLSRKKLDADVTIQIDLDQWLFTFKDNVAKLNEFGFSFDGWFSMLTEDWDMDIKFAAMDNSFKSLLSLAPGIYQEDFENLKTSGEVDFHGFVKGIYNEDRLPAFEVFVDVQDGMFQYPELPAAVSNVQMNLLLKNEDGNMDNTLVDLKRFYMDLGKNPIDARLKIENLVNYPVDAAITAKINLADFASFIPMEGTTVKGIFSLDAKAKGIYDSLTETIPSLDILMSYRDGFIKTSEVPSAFEQLNLDFLVKNSSGKMSETVINLRDFTMVFEGEKFHADAEIRDLNNYTWDVNFEGGVNLGKIMAMFPQEGMDIQGRIDADLHTKGNMAALEKERYDQLPTSGSMSVQGFKFVSTDLPQGFEISSANLSFSPSSVQLKNFDAKAGRSDFRLNGSVSNYIGYIMSPDQVLKGNLTLQSNKIDVNEWMSEEESPEQPTESDSIPLELVKIPENLHFVFNSSIKEVIYDNMVLKDMVGQITAKDGVLSMSNLNFNLLDGKFGLTGTYDPREEGLAAFDFSLSIKELSISQAFHTFNTVQVMAPIAENLTGKFSTDFKIGGKLLQDMSPDYASMAGAGLIKIANASLAGNHKMVNSLNTVTKLDGDKEVSIRDILMKAEIKYGRLFVEPFDVNIGKYRTTIYGSNGIDGSVDYKLKMNVPGGAVGDAVSSAISSLTGGKIDGGSGNFLFNIGLGGSYSDPKFSLLSVDREGAGGQSTQQAVKGMVSSEVSKAKDELEEQKRLAEERAKEEADRIRAEAEAKAKEEEERLRKEAEEKARKEAEKLKDRAKDIFKKGGN